MKFDKGAICCAMICRRSAFFALLFFMLLTAAAMAAERYWPQPTPDFYILDQAGMIHEADRLVILAAGQELERTTGAQVVVVTVPTLADHGIERYAHDLFQDWGIGDKEKNNGVLLLIAKEDRRFRIEVGYGLEGTLTDGWSGTVLDGMKEEFRQEEYSAGILTAYRKLVAKTYEAEGAEVPESLQDVSEEPLWWEVLLGALIFLGMMGILIYAVFDVFGSFFGGGGGGGTRRTRYYRGGGSSGGGSSGGGGRSGGGGSSGSW